MLPKVISKAVISILLTSASFVPAALADNLTDNLLLNGFFTVDLTRSSDDINLISNTDQAISYQANEASLKNSVIGAQLAYQLNDNLSFITQGKAAVDQENDPVASIDWAYFSYDLGADTQLRAGKFRVPFMQGTELRNISYSRLWARPLIPSSGAGGYEQLYGAEVLTTVFTDTASWKFQFSAGKAEHDKNQIDNDYLMVGSARYQTDNFWLSAALLHTAYSVDTLDGKTIDDDAHATMASVETQYSFNNFIFNAGISTSKADVTPDDSVQYLSLGYQKNNWIPFVAVMRSVQEFEAFKIQGGNPPPRNGPPRTQVPVGDNTLTSKIVGVKYNFIDGYALKAQFEQVEGDNEAGAPRGQDDTSNVVTLIIEGVF